jgi:hypothetical protein
MFCECENAIGRKIAQSSKTINFGSLCRNCRNCRFLTSVAAITAPPRILLSMYLRVVIEELVPPPPPTFTERVQSSANSSQNTGLLVLPTSLSSSNIEIRWRDKSFTHSTATSARKKSRRIRTIQLGFRRRTHATPTAELVARDQGRKLSNGKRFSRPHTNSADFLNRSCSDGPQSQSRSISLVPLFTTGLRERANGAGERAAGREITRDAKPWCQMA